MTALRCIEKSLLYSYFFLLCLAVLHLVITTQHFQCVRCDHSFFLTPLQLMPAFFSLVRHLTPVIARSATTKQSQEMSVATPCYREIASLSLAMTVCVDYANVFNTSCKGRTCTRPLVGIISDIALDTINVVSAIN